jgi:hypothetical protein
VLIVGVGGELLELAFDAELDCWGTLSSSRLRQRRDDGTPIQAAFVAIGESPALLPPCLFDDGSGQPARKPSECVKAELRSAMEDVLALAHSSDDADLPAVEAHPASNSNPDRYRIAAAHTRVSTHGHGGSARRQQDLHRLVVLSDTGNLTAFTMQSSSDATRGLGGAGSGAADSSTDARNSSGTSGGASALVGGVATGLLTAVHSLRQTTGGKALEATLDAPPAWVPAWLTTTVRTAAAAAVKLAREHAGDASVPGAPEEGAGAAAGVGAAAFAGTAEPLTPAAAAEPALTPAASPLSASTQAVVPHTPLRAAPFCERDFQFADADKALRRLVPSPSGHLLLATDAAGRVLLLDAADLLVLRLWKGFRDARVAWVRRPGAAAADATPPIAACAVAILAPTRGVLELWEPHGALLARARLPKVPAHLAGAVRLISVAGSRHTVPTPAERHGAAAAAASAPCAALLQPAPAAVSLLVLLPELADNPEAAAAHAAGSGAAAAAPALRAIPISIAAA